jgi:hypothetical protein
MLGGPELRSGGTMEQKIVVHMKSGTIHKGITQDFDPAADLVHFLPAEGGGIPLRLRFLEMKALFWVKDYLGNRHFVANRRFDETDDRRKAIVTFHDGEEMWGTIDGRADDGTGFFLIPADKNDNNVRIFVIRSAMKEIRFVS